MFNNLSLRVRSYLRRRHKFSLIYSLIIFIVVGYFIIVPNLIFSDKGGRSTDSGTNNSSSNGDSPMLTSKLIDDLSNEQTYLKSLAVTFISYVTRILTGRSDGVDANDNNDESSTTKSNKAHDPNDVIETLQQNEYEEEQKEEAQQEQDSKTKNKNLTPEQLELKKQENIKKIRIIKDSMKKINSKVRYNYFQQIFQNFYDNRPQIPPLDNYLTSKRIYHARYDTSSKNKLIKKSSKPVRIKKDAGEDEILTQDQDEEKIIFSESYLNQFLQIDETALNSMTESHSNLISSLLENAPSGVYKGNGIVFVGGGSFNWLTLLSVKSVRAMGSELPIEVLIPKLDEYELDICARIFPALGARCIYLPYALRDPDEMDQEELEESINGESQLDDNINDTDDQTKRKRDIHTKNENIINKFEFKGYQYKALAILLSSFENVLLLDSDNIPVHKPDYLFSSEPFKSHGLIVWPDFWRRATSPIYYKIAGIKVSHSELLPKYDEVNGAYIPYDSPPTLYENDEDNNNGNDDQEIFYGDYDDYQEEEQESFLHIRRTGTKRLNLKRIPLHQRKGSIPDPTSESGQLMISKQSHNKALLLALYYNLYGPNYFYPLFSQGSDGEGDKETFLAATVALDKPFYQVSKFLNAFGYFNSNNEFIGTGMGQYDPVEDYEYSNQWKSNNKNPKHWEFLKSKDPLIAKGPRILFVHSNFPKLNPWKLKTENKIIDAKTKDRIRLYGTGMKVRTGYDFEYVQWTNMKFLLCDLKIELLTFKDVNRFDLCREIHEHIVFLKSTMGSME